MNDATGTTEPATPVKRKARTLEEREAALKAQLADLRTQARAKNRLRLRDRMEQYEKLQTRINELEAKRIVLGQEIQRLELELAEGEPDE